LPDLPVSSVMQARPESVSPDAPLVEVVERLLGRDYTELPVVDGLGRIVGAIGDVDLVRAGATSAGLSLEKAVGPEIVREQLARVKRDGGQVRSLMRTQVLAVGPAARLREAATLMHENGVRHLFVVDDEWRLIGVIGRLDIFQRIVSGYGE